MGARRYPKEKIVTVLREGEVGSKIAELCPKYGVSDATYLRSRSQLITSN